MATITCQECGEPRKRAPSNTKLCVGCRVLRDVTFWRDRIRVCNQTECKTQFAPLHRGDYVCGNCDLSPLRGECRWCHIPNGELISTHIPICVACAKDPAKRLAFIGALRKQQDRRRETNGWTAVVA